ncbi:hypothetical protein TIFTF001_034278 [Ficus carica]|uniref:Uncharacterized protein n=1 Tax=Ficus carica TaxID=3494 RepID=A0AA88E087_FICCA|nr:hypothetical protein TIFTF001_034278 [Ficus carica]
MESRSVKQLLPEAGKGEEQVKEADDVKLDVVVDIESEHLFLSSLTDKVEMDGEQDAGAKMNTGYRSLEHDRVYEYARSIVERANGKCALYRVHSGLRDVSAKQYEPVLVSIGPYHHGKIPLRDMERHKIHYLRVLLDRVKERSIASYVDALKNGGGEIQAFHCYRDTHQMEPADSFGECMVRDGFFLIELFRGTWRRDRGNDMLFNRIWMMPLLKRDMLLFENQIPLFVLRSLFALTDQTHNEYDLVNLFATPNENSLVKKLFEFTVARHDSDSNFVELALGFFYFNRKPIPNLNIKTSQLDHIPHLLGLVYEALIVSRRKTLKPKQQNNNRPKSWEPIWTAVALEQVGVKFRPAKHREAFYDISFRDGVLSIPPLGIHDSTESFFRNLVAYEQYSKYYTCQQVGNYLKVMDCLINSAKDVELLRHCGIIDNGLGDDEKVSIMFNHIRSGVCYVSETFFYAEMFTEVNEFCTKRRNVWIAKLKNEYFGSPWALVSFVGALLLLSLTILQTVYSLHSYYQPKI